ncbi:aminoglycoside phosphotransferase [Kribbella flavida DSM 17836]|uniref:Aminoglycoside phosphotransferase n=1 Tax=Kribbella flavida (strain DSM 17836 / JCM 10339 / NBRC 14399) TaxID=479435 RepID=D2PUZ5_KRIFD|nr:aminoglycoside phosphotransferase family protein [Kribbella flavida]ADB31461.1 aminoglycoside phosphotransferase [Kribbella flavida DSM 17836]
MAHAVGVRLPYEKVPPAVRGWVERVLGSQVVSATTQQGGFSPGVAARLVTASGRRAFVKAVGAELNPDTPQLFRNEIAAMTAITPLPHAPVVYDTYDDGRWVALLLEDIDGYLPPHPWRPADVDRVLGALAQLSDALDPSPWPEAPVAAVRSEAFLSRWDLVIADGLAVPDWVAGREAELAALARTGVAALAEGKALSHWDLRADNILVTEQRVVFVDWAHAALAPRWADTVILYADMYDSVALPELPDDLGITGFIAAIAGGQWWGSAQPAPPGLPTARLAASERPHPSRLAPRPTRLMQRSALPGVFWV